MEQLNVYVISGLGADRRAFQKLNFPARFRIIHIDWISPLENESLESYATRLAGTIDPGRPFVLMGLSFGGLVAGEIAKTLNPQLTLLISSMKTHKQMRGLYRFARFTGFYKILPYRLLKGGNVFTYMAFGVKKREDKEVLKNILADTDLRFLKWAIRTLLHWKNETPAQHIFHIHGDRDRLIPIRSPQPDHVVKQGGHLMVLTSPAEVSKIICEKLETL